MVEDGIIKNYAICGAMGAMFYIESTSTDDIDIIISFNAPPSALISLGPIYQYLLNKGYVEYKHAGIMIEGWEVQFLPTADKLDEESLVNARLIALPMGESSVPVRVFKPEYLVANALKIGRPKDLIRVTSFINLKAVNLNKLKDVLLRHDMVNMWKMFCNRVGISDPKIKGLIQ